MIRKMALSKGIKTFMPYGMRSGAIYIGCTGYHYNTPLDGQGKRWPARVGAGRHSSGSSKGGNCPFSLIFKRWIIGKPGNIE